MGMCLGGHLSSVCFWIFLVLLHYVASLSRNALFDQNTEEENFKVKIKKSLETKNDIKLQDVNSCDCRDYCADPNSTELEVSFRKFHDKLISYYYDYADNIRGICERHVSVYLYISFYFFLMPFLLPPFFQRLVWIENHPLFCKESGRIDIDKKPYLAGCFFFCCRSCNAKYHECVLTLRREGCLKAAYDCVGTCLHESSLQITIKGW